MSNANTLFVVESGMATAIKRLPKSHKLFDEAWVRDLIFQTPDLLPVEEILSDAGTFLPIGIEVPLGRAGIADVLGVTTGGYPVVVETKLWRNPQSRREVFAQTIDYIKEIAKHDYAWFEKMWTDRRAKETGRSLFETVAAIGDVELDEPEFIDRLSRACRSGDILGFIVGDGIQHGLVELIAYLSRESSHLRYILPLLELRCFELSDGKLAVMPTITQEVTPIERAYIKIEPASELADQLKISSVSQPELPVGTSGKRFTLTEDEFWKGVKSVVGEQATRQLSKFIDEVKRSADVELDYRQRAVMLKVPDPVGTKPSASVFAITNEGTAYNSMHVLRQAERWGIPRDRVQQIVDNYYSRLNKICTKFQLQGIVHTSQNQFVPLDEFKDRLDEIASAIEGVASELRAEHSEERS